MLPRTLRRAVREGVRRTAQAVEGPWVPQATHMTLRDVVKLSVFTLSLAAVVVACDKKPALPPPGAPPAAPKAEPVTLTLTAAADVNPDANSRPSPVVVRVYQLKNDAAF